MKTRIRLNLLLFCITNIRRNFNKLGRMYNLHVLESKSISSNIESMFYAVAIRILITTIIMHVIFPFSYTL